ncbi:hypothetical protein LCGC14_2238580, partial [marine sediment metagenome]
MTASSGVVELLTDRKRLIESVVPIENKDRQLVPFIFNPIQADMMDTSVGRDIYVKPAQVGGTSLIMCDFLLDCLMFKGTTAVIISYDEFITGRLLRKVQAFYDNLIQVIPSLPKLHHKSVSEKTYVFEDRMGVKQGESSFYIASAKGFAMPRGEPIHDLLLDELAFWPQESKNAGTERGSAAERVFAAAINRVPLLRGTKIRALSTPNGEDNDFYEMYMAAKEGKATGKSVFKAHFYPWFQMPEYSLSADNEFVLPGDNSPILQDLTPEELQLMVHFQEIGIDVIDAYDKLRWRRYNIAAMASLKRSGETRLLFGQEYPEDDVSCVFPTTLVLLGDGSTKTIFDLVRTRYSGDVLTTEKGILTKRPVTGWYKTPRHGRRLYRLTYHNAKAVTASKNAGSVLTEEHKVLAQRGWVEARNLVAGELIATGTPAPGRRTRQLIIGTVLGDAHISAGRQLSFSQTVFDWAAAKAGLLQLFSPCIYKTVNP